MGNQARKMAKALQAAAAVDERKGGRTRGMVVPPHAAPPPRAVSEHERIDGREEGGWKGEGGTPQPASIKATCPRFPRLLPPSQGEAKLSHSS